MNPDNLKAINGYIADIIKFIPKEEAKKALRIYNSNLEIIRSNNSYVKIIPTVSSLLEDIGEGTYIGSMVNPLVGRKYRAFKGDNDGYGDTASEALISLQKSIGKLSEINHL